MPYKDQHLQAVREGLTGSSEFVYETPDPAAEVSTPTYFAAARHRLRRNDVIRVVAEAQSANPAFTVFIVASMEENHVNLVSVPDLVEDRIGGHGWARVEAAKPKQSAGVGSANNSGGRASASAKEG